MWERGGGERSGEEPACGTITDQCGRDGYRGEYTQGGVAPHTLVCTPNNPPQPGICACMCVCEGGECGGEIDNSTTVSTTHFLIVWRVNYDVTSSLTGVVTTSE